MWGTNESAADLFLSVWQATRSSKKLLNVRRRTNYYSNGARDGINYPEAGATARASGA